MNEPHAPTRRRGLRRLVPGLLIFSLGALVSWEGQARRDDAAEAPPEAPAPSGDGPAPGAPEVWVTGFMDGSLVPASRALFGLSRDPKHSAPPIGRCDPIESQRGRCVEFVRFLPPVAAVVSPRSSLSCQAGTMSAVYTGGASSPCAAGSVDAQGSVDAEAGLSVGRRGIATASPGARAGSGSASRSWGPRPACSSPSLPWRQRRSWASASPWAETRPTSSRSTCWPGAVCSGRAPCPWRAPSSCMRSCRRAAATAAPRP